MTAHRAMRELQAKGLVTRTRGRGTIVAGGKPAVGGQIALVLRYGFTNLEARFLASVHSAVSDQYQLVVSATGDDPCKEAEILEGLASSVRGIILTPTCEPGNSPLIQSISETGTPVVCIDTVPENLNVDGVVSDNFGDTLKALRHLIEQGHQRIAHLTWQRMILSSVRERYQAYVQAMSEVRVENTDYLVRAFMFGCDWAYLRQMVFDALGTMLSRPNPPTAIFCLGEAYLTAVLDVCSEMEISVPTDLEIVSYVEQPWMLGSRAYSVNRIMQRLDEIGYLAGERLKARLQGDDSATEVVRLPADFCRPGMIPNPIDSCSASTLTKDQAALMRLEPEAALGLLKKGCLENGS